MKKIKNSLRTFREETLAITQTQLAALIGMGVASINRYENGAEPTPAHTQLLTSLEEDPNTLLRMLTGKEELLGKPTHSRLTVVAEGLLAGASLQQVKELQKKITSPELTGKRDFDLERLIQMVMFFTQLGEWKTKLNKLLFYSDFLAFKELGRSISGTRYVRGSYGPIPDQYQQLFAALLENARLIAREEFSSDDRPVEKLVANKAFDRSLFSKRELEILEFIYNFFRNKSAKETVDLSHEEQVYLAAADGESLPYRGAISLKISFTPIASAKPKQSLTDLARGLISTMSKADLANLPTDSAKNHDHHLYGAPKKK